MDDSDRIGVGSGLMRSNVVLSRGSLAMLADGERGILELIARGSDLRTTLDALVRMLEAQCQGMVCSIALLSADGLSLRHGAAPSLPRAFRDAIDGLPIGPDFGSCGSAIFNRAPVIVSDIATDPLWDRYRHFALPHGLRACWSTPIIGTGEEILGAFAIYYRMPARPSPQDQAIIAVATHLAAIAIGRDRSEQALRHSEARLSDIIRSTMNAVITFDREQTILLFNDAAARLFDCPASAAIGQRVTRFLPDLQAPVSRAIGQHDMRGYRDDGMTILVEAAISQADSAGETVFTALLRDVGERRRQEREIARLNRLYAVRSAVNQAIVRCRHGNGLLAEICRIIVEQGAFRMAWIGRHDPAEAAIRPVAVCGDTDGFLSGVTIRTDDGPLGGGPVGSAFRHGTTQIYNDFLKNPASLPWRDRARRFGIGAVAAFVIRQRGACWGTLAIYATETDCFQASEITLLDRAAADISFALDLLADETDRRRAEAKAQRLAALVESSEDAIISETLDGIITSWNPAAERIFGFAADEALGQPIGIVMPPERLGDEADILARIRQGQRVRNFETMRRRRSGETFPCSVTMLPIHDPDGVVAGASKIVRDITLRRRHEQALRDLNERLEQTVALRTEELQAALLRAEAADHAKSAFLATMSHELRTPLNSIIGFTGIILQGMAGPLNPEQAKQLGMVRGSARHLLALINDVLDISKIEAGQLEIHRETLDLAAVMTHAAALERPAAARKGIALHLALPPTLPPMASDRRRVIQILLNLLNNAIKFTERGSVTLSADTVDAWRPTVGAPPRLAVRIQVADTGIGIPAEALPTLFQPFRQVESSLTRTHEGTGLGLAICRRLASMLDGDITAASVPGQGSVFTVTLPTEAVVPA